MRKADWSSRGGSEFTRPAGSNTGSRFLGTFREYLLVGLIACVIAIVVIRWVGGVTLYVSIEGRAIAHEAILTNTLPPGVGTWTSMGANGLNVRVATVWLVEIAQRVTGWRLNVLYQLLDLAGVTLGLLLLHVLLRHWFQLDTAIAGVLLVGALLPLTMFFHNFHPWDRPAFVLWAAMALTAVMGRPLLFLGLFVSAVVVKTDSIFAAGLPLLLTVDRQNIRTPLALSIALGVLGLAIVALLSVLVPGGFESRSLAEYFASNLAKAQATSLSYPPLLTHGLLAVLGLLGWQEGDSSARRLWLFGLLLLLPHALLTNFVEVRAQVGSILCMTPLALFAFRQPQGP